MKLRFMKLRFMKLHFSVFFIVLAASIAQTGLAQTYTISTIAGAGVPNNVPAKTTNFGTGAIPNFLTSDAAGNLFFVDQNTVLRLDAVSGLITQFAGNGSAGYTGDNGPATSAALNDPQGMALDSAGNLYIADSRNNVIRKVSNGVITTVAGNGAAGSGCLNGPAVSAQLNFPSWVALDSAGSLYISDTLEYCVRKVSNGTITTVAGSGQRAYSGDGGPAVSARLGPPEGIALDSHGNLYIADAANNVIREVTASNGTISTIAGNNQCCAFSGVGGPATAAEFSAWGIAVDSAGNVYASDSGDSLILEISSSNNTLTVVAGIFALGPGYGGDGGPAASAQLSSPQAIALDGHNNLYIADQGNGRIREISNGAINTIAGTGQTGNNGPATAAIINSRFIAVDAAGDLYFSQPDTYVVSKVSAATGIITTVAGNGTPGSKSESGVLANGAPLSIPFGVALDPAGNLFIADSNFLQIFEVSGGVLTSIAGNGQFGIAGVGGPAPAADLLGPSGIALDSAGDIYFSDDTDVSGTVGGPPLSFNPLQDRLLKISNGTLTQVAGDGSRGSEGDGGPAISAQLLGPQGLATDSAGNIYIADTGNDKIRKITAETGIITTVAGTGARGFFGDNGQAVSAELKDPQDVAVDSSGNIYIADSGNYSIRKVSSNGIITTIAGTGKFGFSGDGGPATNAELFFPAGVAVDTSGRVYIGDGPHVRVLTPAGLPAIAAVTNAEGGNTAIAPNTWVTISGSDLAPEGDSRIWGSSDFVNGQMPTQLDGVSVTVNGQAAYIYYISPTQVNILTPPGAISGSVNVQLANKGGTSNPFPVEAQTDSPSFFIFGGGPYVAATHADGSLIGPTTLFPGASTPAKPGETVLIYANGFGATSTPVVSGGTTQSGKLSPLPVVTIGGAPATVAFAGLNGAPGEFQFNVVIPASLASGDQQIVATYNGLSTQPGVLITVQ
jgi:trimeric autotransporter adhesin